MAQTFTLLLKIINAGLFHIAGMCESDQKVSVNATVSLIKREIDVTCNDTISTSVRPPTERPSPTTTEQTTRSASTQSVTTAATASQSTSGPTVHTTGSFDLEPKIGFTLH